MTGSALFHTLLVRLAPGALALVLALDPALLPARAQVEVGAICVATFADLNGNGQRDEGETPLAGVMVNLATGGRVIATHVMAEGEAQYCFERLLTGAYTVTFAGSPAYQHTTASEGTFNLDPGQRLTITDFGAAPVAAPDQSAETGAVVLEAAPSSAGEPIDPTLRLLISTVAAVSVMVFMIGIGAIVLGARGLRPRRRAQPRPEARDYPPPPAHIEPPRG